MLLFISILQHRSGTSSEMIASAGIAARIGHIMKACSTASLFLVSRIAVSFCPLLGILFLILLQIECGAHHRIFACLLDKLGSRQCEVKIPIGYFHLVCRYACLTFSLPKESAMPSFKVLSSSTIRIFIRHSPAL